jgi:hypothetical protein
MCAYQGLRYFKCSRRECRRSIQVLKSALVEGFEVVCDCGQRYEWTGNYLKKMVKTQVRLPRV